MESSTNSELGSSHNIRTLLCRIKSIGEYLKAKAPEPDILKIWGNSLYDTAVELFEATAMPFTGSKIDAATINSLGIKHPMDDLKKHFTELSKHNSGKMISSDYVVTIIDLVEGQQKTKVAGYLFEDRFYKDLTDLRGFTMSAENTPTPVYYA